MILIADSGSTKTDWMVIDNDNLIADFYSIGLNPVFISSNQIASELKNSGILNYVDHITEIHFYGAGCGSSERNRVVSNGLSQIFPNIKIYVSSDLQGAAVALFKKQKGIAGILGTGSNTGLYDGNKIVNNINSLGYILGDEGSGAYIGKLFVKAFLDNELPEHISKKFYEETSLNKEIIIKRVYKDDFPNRFLASFMIFIHNNIEDEYIRNLVSQSFEDFFAKTILKYESYSDYETRITGSVAHYFSDVLYEAAWKQKVNLTLIAQSPKERLIEYYTNK